MADRSVRVHSVLAIVPASCWPASFVLDVASRALPGGAWLQWSYWLLLAGLAGAIVAGVAGFADAMPIPDGSRAHKRAMVHMSMMLAVVVLYGINIIVRGGAQPGAAVPAGVLALSVLCLALMAAAIAAGLRLARGVTASAVHAAHAKRLP